METKIDGDGWSGVEYETTRLMIRSVSRMFCEFRCEEREALD